MMVRKLHGVELWALLSLVFGNQTGCYRVLYLFCVLCMYKKFKWLVSKEQQLVTINIVTLER